MRLCPETDRRIETINRIIKRIFFNEGSVMFKSTRIGTLIAMGVISIFSLAQAATYTISVNAGTKTGSWNRFYERGVASDHMHTVLSTAYGRGIKNAMKIAHDSCGFEYIRATAFWTMTIRYIPKTEPAPRCIGGTVSTGSTIQSPPRE